jgi:DNA mismatch repair protein MutL
MPTIHILDPEVRGKIAAGEVITRPVSVIKELVENALDAGARRVEISIKDGGKRSCLVNDDGIGMAPEDARLAIERYGTSKIEQIDDIDRIKTYGFRGEALASIAQVSHFEMETSDGTHGTKIIVEGGETKRISESRRPRGTRVQVDGLFYNLPARYKFLKSSQWERRLIIECVKTYALMHPDVYFLIEENNRKVIEFLPVTTVEQRLRMYVPKVVSESIRSVVVDTGTVKIDGYFSQPGIHERRGVRNIYVNRRPVKYSRIYRTIMDAYENPKEPPLFFLEITTDPAFVDVNMHPTKNEVKFKDERYILDILGQALRQQVFKQGATAAREPHIPGGVQPSAHELGQYVQDTFVSSVHEQQGKTGVVRESEEFWQLHNTYILSQTRSGMIIVDQHVAHERIIYESIMKGKSGAQRLLFPITLELTSEEFRAYRKTKHILRELGVEFKEFSSHTVVIDSLPSDAHVTREDIEGFFKEIDGLGTLIKEKAEIAKVVACRSAIKAGQKLSVIEMQELIDRLFACDNPYTCPHGRPIVIRLSLEELGSKFGRE